ncbi:ATP phosphoribosyltransferase [Thermaerobacter marianensis DSM 12885]|uniref:ATP phosphoribosyltransferase n=1 Tax=Thermaerobacter marianensis (strain ATCC 700841 / DSM 12885 / JCM 10246 / 7p75a) TaxID=644966 RepID=E6SHF3_THEM7|nr:ATP phosphoribosyltransferase [Thermaerobacter marianensis]ADU50717.1 ATP phosphoribosyltransferase [Thermaerobacter marianensis DSM 12885]
MTDGTLSPLAGSPARPLTLALPKGRMLPEVAALCARAGIAAAAPLAAGGDPTALLLDDAASGVRLLLVRPGDVWSYVAFGGADLGITGKDVLEEMAGDARPGRFDPPGAVELVDLRAGACRMAVAGPAAGAATWPWRRTQPGRLRVATKYPACARRALGGGPLEVEVIPLAGSVELAPLVGLADVIVDLVATGRTLRAHGLVEYEVLFSSTARLIANEASLRLREEAILPLVERLEKAAAAAPAPNPGTVVHDGTVRAGNAVPAGPRIAAGERSERPCAG